jgi:hypothetical protein
MAVVLLIFKLFSINGFICHNIVGLQLVYMKELQVQRSSCFRGNYGPQCARVYCALRKIRSSLLGSFITVTYITTTHDLRVLGRRHTKLRNEKGSVDLINCIANRSH